MSINKDYTYNRVKVDIVESVATVYLFWPDGLRDPKTGGSGAEISMFHDELSDALRQLRDDDSVRVVIIRGPGDRYFLSTFAGVEDSDPALRGGSLDGAYNTARTASSMLEPILKMAKPVIAMVNGDAIGIGASIAMACDLVIAAEDAYITDCHIANYYWMKRADVSQGTVPGDGGAVFWPLDMSLHLAKEFLLTGRPITARELADMHVINRAVPRDQLQSTVDEMVQLLLDRPAWALGWAKIAINKRVLQNFELTLDLGLAYELLATSRKNAEDQRGITHI